MKMREQKSSDSKKQRPVLGDVFQIKVNDQYYYGQVLIRGVYAFFDFHSNDPIDDLSVLNNCPILFQVCVYADVITRGVWTIVGKIPVREGLLPLMPEFIYHKDGLPEFELYNPNNGEIHPATKEECKGLELCSVWDSNHVTDRLLDYYANRPCVWLKERNELFSR